MSNYCPISKISHYVKLEGYSLECIQLNTDIIYAHVIIHCESKKTVPFLFLA